MNENLKETAKKKNASKHILRFTDFEFFHYGGGNPCLIKTFVHSNLLILDILPS